MIQAVWMIQKTFFIKIPGKKKTHIIKQGVDLEQGHRVNEEVVRLLLLISLSQVLNLDLDHFIGHNDPRLPIPPLEGLGLVSHRRGQLPGL